CARTVELNAVLALLEAQSWPAPLRSLCQQLREGADGTRTHDEIDQLRALEHLLPCLLRDPATRPHDHFGPPLLQAAPRPDQGEGLLRRRLADAAGVQEEDVGFGDAIRGGVPQALQDSGQLLGIVEVHLASPGLNLVSRLRALRVCFPAAVRFPEG